MKRTVFYLCALLPALAFLGCEDNRMQGMIDDRVCLLKSDYLQVPVINFGVYEYPVVVSKGGIKDQEAVVSFKVNKNYLDEYNDLYDASLELLPEDCYKMPPTLTIKGEELTGTVKIIFNTQKIYDLQQSKEHYVLPLEIVSENGIAIYSGKNYVILSVIVEEATIGFYKSGFTTAMNFTPGDPDEIEGYTEIDLNYTVDHNVMFQLQVAADSLERYNQMNVSNYKLLPADAYVLNQEEWRVEAGEKTAKISYRILRNKLVNSMGAPNLDEYVLPLRISEVSAYKIHPLTAVQMLHFSYTVKEFEKTGWNITGYNSCDNTYLPENIIDGNTATFWRSQTDAALMKPLAEEPYFISFDMLSNKSICQIKINQRTGNSGNRNLKVGYFEYSTEETDWTKLQGSDFVWSNRADTVQYVNIAPTVARNLKIVMTEGFSELVQGKYVITLSELTVSGYE
ncbi:MAG: DUF1735 domain-containing protein [Dysgonamonadaceae bacterium]|jgi:hypothetical protein|nr:DUF1735 domain-containing protein [Dysgonamonadaceae bacterium]